MSTFGLDGVLSWAKAHHVASTCARPLPDTFARLDEAAGSILAQPILTLSADPAVDSAAINGYAVCGAGPWRLADEPTLRPGHAMRMRTGDPLPQHTDAVLAMEGSISEQHGDGTLSVIALDELTQLPDERARPGLGSGIIREAEVAPSGALLVPAGRIVTPSILAIAAAAGHDGIEIVRPPVVGVIVLGTSLLSQGQSRGGRVRDQALGVTKVVGDLDQRQRIEETERAGLAARNLKGDQVRSGAHLLLDDLRLRMVGAAGIEQPRELGVAGQRVGDRRRGFRLPLHAHRQGFQSLQQNPGVERRHCGAGLP